MKRIHYYILFTILFLFGKETFPQSLDEKIIRIPVIFHVLYSDRTHDNRSDGGNINENLSTELLLTELKDLHDDFLLLNRDTADVIREFKNIIGNPQIEFYLADTVLEQKGEKGIIRIKTKRNKRALPKRSKVFNPNKYFNIYIGDIGSSFVNSSSPWNNPDYDCVNLGFDWVGQHYRLLTHETGHWLGLLHIYGGGGGAKGGGCDDKGDSIHDTPPQYRATDILCLKCPPDVKDQTCVTGNLSNFNNYMDYSGCRKMFTIEQSKNMRLTLKKDRSQMWTNTK